MQRTLFRPTGWNILAVLLVIVGLIIAVYRYIYGLGAVTHLSDTYPWGLWIAFDVMCGVALAAGGFLIAGTVHIFNLKRYEPILRPAVVTAFLGYFLVIIALLVDLGLPWRIYHPVYMWQVHSAMFEVAMCVFFYFIVLFLEFLPMLFQGLTWKPAYRALHAITIPLVIIGIILSFMHQSSLGSVLLLTKEQLNPLWFSLSLPFNFFLSAVAVGLAMVMFESHMSSRMYKRAVENNILSSLAKGCAYVLGAYFVWRVIDISMNNGWGGMAAGYEAFWFWMEIVIGVIVPFFILIGAARTQPGPRFWAALMVIVGLILNRLNATLTGMIAGTGEFYFPSWQEIFLTIAVVCAGLLLFQAIVQLLPIFEPEVKEAEARMAGA